MQINGLIDLRFFILRKIFLFQGRPEQTGLNMFFKRCLVRPLTAALALFAVAIAPATTTIAAEQDQKEKIMIAEGTVVSFFYTLSSNGEQIESNKGGEPLTYVQGGGQLLPKLEEALAGLSAGDSKEVSLAAADAYGESDPQAIQEVPLEQIPEEAREVGPLLQAEGVPTPIRITEIREDVVVVDFNHPMAGKDLVFAVEIVDVK